DRVGLLLCHGGIKKKQTDLTFSQALTSCCHPWSPGCSQQAAGRLQVLLQEDQAPWAGCSQEAANSCSGLQHVVTPAPSKIDIVGFSALQPKNVAYS
uniref:Uncharacterized protein n=1 Tax=Crocodylus porosus TaxID=8502 RepID=A0A7M4FL12_CROPO